MAAAQRSTLYSTPDVFNSIARRISRESSGPIMLMGLGTRGKKFLNYFSHALEDCEVPHVAYLLQQDGMREDDGHKRGYKAVVDVKPYHTCSTSAGKARPGIAVFVDDMIDTFRQGAGANFYALEHRGHPEIGFDGDLLTVVHYDMLGVAHFSLDVNDKNTVVVGDRDRLIARLREAGPQKFRELQETGAIRYVGRVDHLIEFPDKDAQYAGRMQRLTERIRHRLGLKALEVPKKPAKASIRTDEDFFDQIASGE